MLDILHPAWGAARTHQLESTSEEDIEAFLASRNIASNMTVRAEAVMSPTLH